VKSLQRTRILNIHLGDLPNGQWRDLTKEELDEMFNMMNYEPKR
jgi:23S rRNA pseudouridine2604 synthase